MKHSCYGIDEISCENAYFKIKNHLSEFISIRCDFVTCEIFIGKFYGKICFIT